ncbi:glycosyltransferase family 4 protein [Glaesserella parasuis]|uniref:glycosyltransferase family 4 protein n=1 Tax=Glaesserella parasuis TaxID=738 RepID=UPI0013DFD602|nr:glycosyltransferase family 4 protein [Glaesserella parasuis]QIE76238.1 glycosyltransferase family 4 protein [Glaesserella parasuis]
MRIALVTQYFWPETFSVNDLVKELVSQGHTVDIFTGKPNYPDGNIFEGYEKNGLQVEEFIPGATIYRVPLYPRGQKSAKGLAINYLSFVWYGLMYFPKMADHKNYDHIFAVSLSPITSVIPAIYLGYKKNTPVTMWVLDLWPESLITTGYIKNKIILNSIKCLVKWIYLKSDKIFVQSSAFVDSISEYVDKKKITYFPNFSIDLVQNISRSTAIPIEILNLLDNNFGIVFTGNLGTAQAVETIMDAAKYLQDINDIKLVLVGSGSMHSWLEDTISKNNIHNIILAGRYNSDEMPQFLSRAKGLLVTLKNEYIYSQTIPAKVQTYLASGKPIIASLNGEGAKIIEEAQAGYTCEAENAVELAKMIKKLYESSDEEQRSLGENGRRYFLEQFEIKKQVKKLVKLLDE